MGLSELPTNLPESPLSMHLPRRMFIKTTGLASLFMKRGYQTGTEKIPSSSHAKQTQETSPSEILINMDHGMTHLDFNQNLERLLSGIVPNQAGDEREVKRKRSTQRYWREKDEMGFGIYTPDESVTARVHLVGKHSYSVVTAGRGRNHKGIYIFNDRTVEIGLPSVDDVSSQLHTLHIDNLNEMFQRMHASLHSLNSHEVHQLFFHISHIVRKRNIREHKEGIEALSKHDRFQELIQIWNELTILRNTGIQLDRDSELGILQRYKNAVEELGGVVTEEMIEAQMHIDAQVKTEFQAADRQPFQSATRDLSTRFLPSSRIFFGGINIPPKSDIFHADIPILTEDEAKAFLLPSTSQPEQEEELQLPNNVRPEGVEPPTLTSEA